MSIVYYNIQNQMPALTKDKLIKRVQPTPVRYEWIHNFSLKYSICHYDLVLIRNRWPIRMLNVLVQIDEQVRNVFKHNVRWKKNELIELISKRKVICFSDSNSNCSCQFNSKRKTKACRCRNSNRNKEDLFFSFSLFFSYRMMMLVMV